MTYEAEIQFHGHDETVYEQRCHALQDAVAFIERWAAGRPSSVARINDVRVWLKDCRCVDNSGAPLCTNEQWHAIFARPDEAIKPFRPMPMPPHHPETLKMTGKWQEVA